jgi:N-acetylglucosaminyldiphosphoundecaprenol N-acetyl-beta-D-mannosaminyltransferase
VLGCQIDRVDMTETVAAVDAAIAERRFCQHTAVNASIIVAMLDDPELARVVNDSDIVTADGESVVWAARLLGDPVPARVTGIDLMLETIELAERRGYGIYILGAREDVLERAVERLREQHPKLVIAGYQHGYFDRSEDERVVEDIRSSGAQILYVAITTPRKEYFLGHYGPQLNTPFVMGVGGSIDVVAGVARRAPRWMQRSGLEWFYRLIQEPRRLFRRYAVSNARFIGLVARDAVRARRRGVSSQKA